jgi:LytS/YehU family sensor histidine kinase
MLVIYFVFCSFYKLSIYWIVSQLKFLPANVVSHATTWYKSNVFYHFFSIYELRDLIVLTALAYFIRSAKQDKQISELKQQQLESELNFLKMQMQPHFFFNTLNNIYALTLRKSDKAAPLIARHAEIMRYVLYDSVKEQVSLKQEVNFLKNYVEVESIHYSEKMDIAFETQGINDSALIEPMLLLPFVENTFKHGIREETDKGYVHIIISLVENDLFVEIKNSKPQNINGEKVNGIGLLNASKRLQMLYPDKHKIEIQESDHSYELCLSLILKVK